MAMCVGRGGGDRQDIKSQLLQENEYTEVYREKILKEYIRDHH